MKATVIKTFLDKETRKPYAVKSEWKGSEERFKEINKHREGPFLEAVEAEAKEAKTTRQTKERKVSTETK
ncbi:hypothetical protein C8N40_111123 [Pontibacter mucosus]|uniref:Uncharacterized protein n=1 Tax=Pontibacter mucosus TaxID=1649266 RepID=A0A2T5YD54_9BACT|nr:hypothetical protein [Pontibacter mucosus]PTX14458.1 hypothetical protein C8N40_111123 [Pontibacter mucosus]